MVNNASTPSTQTSTFTLKTFTSPVSFKLKEENYYPWRHQALACIKANKLKNHLDGKKMPQRFANEEDQVLEKETQEWLEWEQQDQHLVSWLLASMESTFTNRMVKCEFAHEVWSKLEEYFAAYTKSKIKQLKNQLKSIKKTATASEYLHKVKKIADSLAVLAAPLSNEEQVEVILEGLNEDYSAFITMAMSQAEPFSVSELEALLLAQEDIIENFKKIELALVQVNVALRTPQELKLGCKLSEEAMVVVEAEDAGASGEVARGTTPIDPNVSYVAELGTRCGSVIIDSIKDSKILCKIL